MKHRNLEQPPEFIKKKINQINERLSRPLPHKFQKLLELIMHHAYLRGALDQLNHDAKHHIIFMTLAALSNVAFFFLGLSW